MVYSATASDRVPEVVAGGGAAGWTLAAVALAVRRPAVLPWGLAGVGAAYAVLLGVRGGVDRRAPVVAAALFAAAELGFWSVETVAGRSGRAVELRRLAVLVAAALGTTLVGGLLLVLAAGVGGGVGLEVVGVLAAILTLASIAFLTRQSRDSAST